MDQQKTLKNNNRRLGLDTPINSSVQMLAVLYLLIWSVSPPLAIDNIYRMLALGAAGIWFVLSMLEGLKLEKIHIYAIGFLLAVMLISVFDNQGNLSALTKPISTYMLVIAFIMNYAYKDRWNELHILVPVFLILTIVFNIITFRELLADPTLSRKIVRADEEIYPYMRRGVGGYALIYLQVFLFPLLFSWIRRAIRWNKIYMAIGLFWLISYILLILNAGYSIAIVTTISSLVVLFIYKRKSIIPALIITLLIIILLVWLIGNVDPFREALLGFFDGTKVANKITDIYNSLHGVEVADSIASRIDRYSASIQTAFHYPLIGSLWFEGSGGHSAILDTFAKYGFWGFWIFSKMFYCVPVGIKAESDTPKDIRIANAMLVSMLLVTLLDSLPYEMVFPVLIIAPLLFNDIKLWRQENEGTLDRQSSAA